MVADFSRTARAVIFTDAPGVVLVPVGQEADGGVPAGVDGGLDDGGMPTGTDAGAPAGDGSTAAPKVGGGCECGAATAGAPAPGIAGLLALALVAWRRRRYRDCGSNAV
jgi:MYXO-CTERM domain-containing protein